MPTKVFSTTFWQAGAAPVLARVTNGAGELIKQASEVASVVYTMVGQRTGKTKKAEALTPTWHDPPKGTPSEPDARWENRLYEEDKAGYNFEATLPADAAPEGDFYRLEITVTLTDGYEAYIILEGPAYSRAGV